MAEMTALVRSAYQRLAEMGFRFWGTWQEEEDTRRRCSEGHCLVAEKDARLVGTVTTKLAHEQGDPDWYRKEGVWVVTQFAVAPEVQGEGLGSKLLTAAEAHAFHQGGTEAAIDTAEGAKHLVDFYAKRGYRHVGKVDWEGTNYLSVLMSKRLRPRLTTERLLLRELCREDIEVFKSHWADERFQACYPPGRMTPEFCEELFGKEVTTLALYPRKNYHWTMEQGSDVIGGVRLSLEPGSCATLGYGLSADRWGKGLATEAVAEVVRYAFEELRLNRVQAWVFANNRPSQKLLERLGFVLEGTMREKVAWEDRHVDDHIYGLLRADWH